ncbi:MAG: hypothetical protein AAGK14_13610 [Verrucomicrobiota bacterium]
MEIITDPGYETLGQPDSPWHIEAHEVAGITAQGIDGICCLQVVSPHQVQAHAEMRYGPFPVERGQEIALHFQACAETAMPFRLRLSEWHEPNRCLCSPREKIHEWRFEADWRRYEYTFHIIHSEPRARLNFELGGSDNRLWLTRLRLVARLPESAKL